MALVLRELIPPLTARTPAGKTLRAWDYKQKRSVVIAFLHTGCRRCEGFVENLAARAAELGYDVTVVRDAIADYSDEMMHATLDINMPNYASSIVTTGEIVDSISSLQPVASGA